VRNPKSRSSSWLVSHAVEGRNLLSPLIWPSLQKAALGLARCEALMGVTPGGGATQYLGLRMTRGRALEILVGADLFDARTAERYGWVNRALPADEIDDFVERLARQIAALPEGVIAAAKTALPPEDIGNGYAREHAAWSGLFARPAAEKLIRGGLEAGAQTRSGERDLEALLRRLDLEN
jgi:enoyl-CoA hydratase/carnithine racemase